MAKLKLDHPGIGEMLKSKAVARVVEEIAFEVSANAEHTTSGGDVLDSDVTTYTTDRAAAAVTLLHPAALRVEAKHGVLARAAQAAGLDVTSRAPKE